MCGRYFLSEVVEGINDTLEVLHSPDLRTGANLAPTESVSGLTLNAGRLELRKFRWGLIPSWSRRDPARERPLINARIETVGEKPSFKESFYQRRTVLPASGFIEWRGQERGRKVPYRVEPSSGEIVGLAGIWDSWRSPRGEVIHSVAVLTREASSDFQAIHHRLPVMLRQGDWKAYLSGKLSSAADVLQAATLVATLDVAPIGTGINRPGRQDAELLKSSKPAKTLKAS